MLTESLKNRIRDPYVTRRAGYMLVFIIVFTVIVDTLLPAAILIQFVHLLFTGRRNRQLIWVGKFLTDYTSAIVRYLTFASEDKPFPFGEWPTFRSSTDDRPLGETNE